MAKAVAAGTALIELPPMSAEVAAFFEEEANIKPKTTVPSLSPGGKKWTLSLDGQDTVLSRTNAEGDVEPIQIFKGFVLAAADRRGRAYYTGGYDPAKPGIPVCWSDDGVKPHDKVDQKQNPTCDGCPMSMKNSKITDSGKGVRACSEHRMLAVIPASKLDFPFLRLKISITSDWDGQSPDHEAAGWYAWSNYLDVLRARMPNACHTARVVTKMKFDPNVDYPKILFSMDRGTTPEEQAVLVPRLRAEKATLDALISGTFTPDGRNGVRTDAPAIAAPAAQAPAAKPQAAPAKAPEVKAAAPVETPAQKALREAKAALAAAEAAAVEPPPPPAETPKQKALREAKEALARAEAEAEAGEGDTAAGEAAGASIDDDDDLVLPPTTATAAPAAAAKAEAAKPAGKGTKAKAAPAAAATPPAAGSEALKGLLTDWE